MNNTKGNFKLKSGKKIRIRIRKYEIIQSHHYDDDNDKGKKKLNKKIEDEQEETRPMTVEMTANHQHRAFKMRIVSTSVETL